MSVPGLPVAESRRGDEDRSLSWSDMTTAAQVKFEVSCQKGSTGARARGLSGAVQAAKCCSSRAEACEMKMDEMGDVVSATAER